MVLGFIFEHFYHFFKSFQVIIEEKYMFYLKKFSEIFNVNFFVSENINSDVKLKNTITLIREKNQNDFS